MTLVTAPDTAPKQNDEVPTQTMSTVSRRFVAAPQRISRFQHPHPVEGPHGFYGYRMTND